MIPTCILYMYVTSWWQNYAPRLNHVPVVRRPEAPRSCTCTSRHTQVASSSPKVYLRRSHCGESHPLFSTCQRKLAEACKPGSLKHASRKIAEWTLKISTTSSPALQPLRPRSGSCCHHGDTSGRRRSASSLGPGQTTEWSWWWSWIIRNEKTPPGCCEKLT